METKDMEKGEALIGDGPNEIIQKSLVKFAETNRKVAQELAITKRMEAEAKATRKDNEKKMDVACSFISLCEENLGINKEQLWEILGQIGIDNISCIEKRFINKARFDSLRFFCFPLVFLFLTVICLSIGELATIAVSLPGLFISLLFAVVSLHDCSGGKYILGLRKLRKKYGPDFFPAKELRKELGWPAEDKNENSQNAS